MKPAPANFPRISSALFYRDAHAAIDWLVRVFGFEVRIRVEHDGVVVHSELTYGEGVVMVAQAGPTAAHPDYTWPASPQSVGGRNTQCLAVYVDDVDAHCAQVRAAGGTVTTEPATSDYGEEYWSDRGYQAVDLEGHFWWFIQRLRG